MTGRPENRPDAAGIGREIVIDAERMGITLRRAGEKLRAAPKELITPAVAWVFQSFRADILAALEYRDRTPAAFYTPAEARGLELERAQARDIDRQLFEYARQRAADSGAPEWVNTRKTTPPTSPQLALTPEAA